MKAYQELLSQLTDAVWFAYAKNSCSYRLYLVGTKRQSLCSFTEAPVEVWDNLQLESEDGDGDIVLSEPIPNHLTRDQLYSWLDSRLRREPLAVILDSYQTA